MKIKEKDHTVVIKKSSETLEDFSKKIKEQYRSFVNKNMIVDLSDEEVRPSTVLLFEETAREQMTNKKSFVIVADIDFDEIDDAIIVVPTLQEAFDIIEMEEIERDLGF
ncbi:MAG TPA: hypothetical protein VLY87_07810 [Flavobacterium sp.]|nr:hypothetical protein [Flavobacterium sp.]